MKPQHNISWFQDGEHKGHQEMCHLLEDVTAPALSHGQSYLRLKHTSEIQAAEVQSPLAEPPYRK